MILASLLILAGLTLLMLMVVMFVAFIEIAEFLNNPIKGVDDEYKQPDNTHAAHKPTK